MNAYFDLVPEALLTEPEPKESDQSLLIHWQKAIRFIFRVFNLT